MDRRLVPGLVAGLVGLACGVAAAVWSSPVLAVAAGFCSLLAGTAAVLAVRQAADAEERMNGEADSAALRHLELFTGPGAAMIPQSLLDHETGLPDDRFFELAVEGRIAAARRHLWPVTLVLLELDAPADPEPDPGPFDGAPRPPAPEHLADFSRILRRTLREADIACRIGSDRFGLILEDTAEEGGVWTAERIQVGLARSAPGVRRLAAGVSTYPSHALRVDELLTSATAALDRACAAEQGHGLGQVEVARAEQV